jgi:hypothetical protein
VGPGEGLDVVEKIKSYPCRDSNPDRTADSSVSIATGHGLEGGTIFLFSTSSRPALEITQPPIQWVSRSSFPGGKAAGV